MCSKWRKSNLKMRIKKNRLFTAFLRSGAKVSQLRHLGGEQVLSSFSPREIGTPVWTAAASEAVDEQ